MTHGAGGQRNRSNARRPGEVRWQLTASDIMSLAINVVQNGFDYRELRPDLAYLVGGSATKPRGRGQSGDAPASDATRTMLEEVYRQLLLANRLEAARVLAEVAGETLHSRGVCPHRPLHIVAARPIARALARRCTATVAEDLAHEAHRCNSPGDARKMG